MSVALEVAIQWVPWAMGVASSSLLAYYANNFVTSDIDTTHGTLSGASGSAIMGVSAASMAVQSWAIIEWIKYMVKREEGRVTTHNRNIHYGRSMMAFWWIMLIFYMVALTSAALNVELVAQYDSLAVTVSGNKLNGTYGDATEGLSYATIGVGGVALLVYLYAEFISRDVTSPHPTVIETHGGI